MDIISLKTLKNAKEKHPAIAKHIDLWIARVKEAKWDKPLDVSNTYTGARLLKNKRIVFNLAKNDYRLIVEVNYDTHSVFIKFIGSHAEYDKIDAEGVNF